jgi:two-component system, sensor histidine kinase PdtaS
MPSMSEIISEHTELSEGDHHWLKLLVSEWQLLADLSFSDLVLWVRDHDPNVCWAAAQIRPFTGATSLFDDVIGDLIAYSPEHLVSEAFLRGEIVQTSEGKLQAGFPVDTHAIPVKLGDRVIAVVEQHTSQLGVRAPSSLEKAYLEAGAELARMITV